MLKEFYRFVSLHIRGRELTTPEPESSYFIPVDDAAWEEDVSLQELHVYIKWKLTENTKDACPPRDSKFSTSNSSTIWCIRPRSPCFLPPRSSCECKAFRISRRGIHTRSHQPTNVSFSRPLHYLNFVARQLGYISANFKIKLDTQRILCCIRRWCQSRQWCALFYSHIHV